MAPMNITSPLMAGAVRAADAPGDSMTSLLRMISAGTGWFDDGVDGGLGVIMSSLAGVAAALAVAIALSVYFHRGDRTPLQIFKHGVAATLVIGLVSFVVYDMRHAALAYLGINPAKPSVEFEIRLPKATLTEIADTQVELLTDRNQKLANVQDALAATPDGRSVLKGTVTLDYRTTERFVVLNLPGQGQTQFKLRLPASPTHSEKFSPWHLADGITAAKGEALTSETHDTFAIRYRVL